MVISLGPGGPVHADVDGSRPLTSASNLRAVMSEIAAGRIALFSRPRSPLGRTGCCCSRRGRPRRQCGLSTRPRASPAFTGHPRSVQLGLSSAVAHDDSDHPLALPDSVVHARRAAGGRSQVGDGRPSGGMWRPPQRCRRGDSNSHEFPHYALNVARLPIPPLRPGTGWTPTGADLGTRTPDLLFTKQLLYRLS